MSPHGGAERIRTDDLLNANQPLFQLSYGPFPFVAFSPAPLFTAVLKNFSQVP